MTVLITNCIGRSKKCTHCFTEYCHNSTVPGAIMTGNTWRGDGKLAKLLELHSGDDDVLRYG